MPLRGHAIYTCVIISYRPDTMHQAARNDEAHRGEDEEDYPRHQNPWRWRGVEGKMRCLHLPFSKSLVLMSVRQLSPYSPNFPLYSSLSSSLYS